MLALQNVFSSKELQDEALQLTSEARMYNSGGLQGANFAFSSILDPWKCLALNLDHLENCDKILDPPSHSPNSNQLHRNRCNKFLKG